MNYPFLGFGVGLRTKHYAHILKTWPQMDFFEVISENYMVAGGRPLHILDQIREKYPVVMHGVSLSIGSTDALNKDYLKKLKTLVDRINPAWISDHLCWTGVGGKNLHDLLPLPYTEETIRHVAKRVRQVQDFLGRQIVLENVSSYISFTNSTMSEWDFLKTIAEEADCKILLDINNIYVSSFNHGFDPETYIEAIPQDRVVQFHLAGHSDKGKYLLDTHDHPVKPVVWKLYKKALERFGAVSTLIEWDDHIPGFPKLQEAAQKAERIYRGYCAQRDLQTTKDAKNPVAIYNGA
jgi:uncharacterized protein (UPF0276 family)